MSTIHFIPPHLATEANAALHRLGIVDSDVRFELLRLVEQAHAVGHESGYVRALSDASFQQIAENEAARKSEQGR